MTIEDRIRRLMADAVAGEPPPRRAPLDHALRRRRRRPAVTGAVALVLVLAAVVGLAVVRGQGETRPVAPAATTTPPAPTTAPPTTSVSTAGWKAYTDATYNLRLRYPPDWVARLRNEEGMVTLAPPEHARQALGVSPPFAVTVTAGGGYYLGEAPEPGATGGRLPVGQAYLRYGGTDPAQRPLDVSYSVDWGRDCKGVEPNRCGPHSVLFSIFAGDAALWDRYGAVAEAIVRAAEPVTPTRPSYGDRRLPDCRPGQWRPVWPREYGFTGPQRLFLSGGVQHLGGPRCHLRARLELLVERDGRPLALPGNPATRTVEGDLPDDGITRDGGSWVMRGGPLFWSFYWDEWCNKGLEGPTLRLSAPTGERVRIGDPAPQAEPSPNFPGCQDRGQPSRLAPWP